MSGFKRYQSKVFWNQMASRDLEDDRFVERSDFGYDCLRKEDEKEKQEEEEEEEGEEAEESTSKSENDTMNDDNITVIRVYKSVSENTNEEDCQISSTSENVTRARIEAEETNGEKGCEIVFANTSCSSLSQDLRSQDSGFSDSERSDCSRTYENVTPWQKLRRKKMRRRRRINSEMASRLSREVSPVNPMHTSTPKDLGKSLRRQRIDEKERSEMPRRLSISLENEYLGDFLYASEPPEDSIQSATTKSSVSTDSVANDAISAGREVLNSRNYRQLSSTRAWLTDLVTETENECSALQNKNLPRGRPPMTFGDVHIRDLKMLTSAATAAASKLLVSVERFEQHYRNIVDKITQLKGGRSEIEFLCSIEESAFSLLSQLEAPPPRRIQQGSLRSILTQLQNMKIYVDGTIDARLDFYIEKIVRGLEEAPQQESEVARGALAALTALGLSDPRAGSSIARCSGIKALLTCLIAGGHRTLDDLIALSLRALYSICCSATAIEYFVQDGGPEILTDLLATKSTSEKERMEATALLVQITAPWTNALGLPYLEPFADSLIPALNRLVENTSCAQTLLLAAAALNQMSKSQLCVDIILAEDSVRKLLKSVKKSAGGNVWLMEQVAALIGELARIPMGRLHLAKVHASVALVSFLRMRPLGLEDAYRRLEITAAATLTRLCVEPEIARQVIEVGGGDCLPTSAKVDDQVRMKNEQPHVEAGLLRYHSGITKSFRRACKKAAKQIRIAKIKDHSPLN